MNLYDMSIRANSILLEHKYDFHPDDDHWSTYPSDHVGSALKSFGLSRHRANKMLGHAIKMGYHYGMEEHITGSLLKPQEPWKVRQAEISRQHAPMSSLDNISHSSRPSLEDHAEWHYNHGDAHSNEIFNLLGKRVGKPTNTKDYQTQIDQFMKHPHVESAVALGRQMASGEHISTSINPEPSYKNRPRDFKYGPMGFDTWKHQEITKHQSGTNKAPTEPYKDALNLVRMNEHYK